MHILQSKLGYVGLGFNNLIFHSKSLQMSVRYFSPTNMWAHSWALAHTIRPLSMPICHTHVHTRWEQRPIGTFPPRNFRVTWRWSQIATLATLTTTTLQPAGPSRPFNYLPPLFRTCRIRILGLRVSRSTRSGR